MFIEKGRILTRTYAIGVWRPTIILKDLWGVNLKSQIVLRVSTSAAKGQPAQSGPNPAPRGHAVSFQNFSHGTLPRQWPPIAYRTASSKATALANMHRRAIKITVPCHPAYSQYESVKINQKYLFAPALHYRCREYSGCVQATPDGVRPIRENTLSTGIQSLRRPEDAPRRSRLGNSVVIANVL
jgi:hypothetical protein